MKTHFNLNFGNGIRAWALSVAAIITLLALVSPTDTRAQGRQVPNPDGSITTWAPGGDGDGLPPYHPQVTAYFCGAASLEMELDCTAVRNLNNNLNTMLGAGVPGAVPPAANVDGVPQECYPGGFCWLPPVANGNNLPVKNVQSFMYGVCHYVYSYSGSSYVNPYYPASMGTSEDELAAALNILDGNNHNYVYYNILNPDWGNRTMTIGLSQLGIPSVASIGHGAHWITVIGVKTDVAPALNKPYKIYGFYIRDPWTGYQQVNPLGPGPKFKKLPEGLGENRFCSTKINPNRMADDANWGSLFTPAFGPPLPYVGSGLGYKFEVEPIGPVQEDTGDNGLFTSIPDPSPNLTNAPLSAADAVAIATNDLDADAFLEDQPGFTNGTWDVANAMLIQYPTDPPDQGDWLIPYEGSGGVSDVTGFVLIDEETGNLDEAVWMNPDDYVPSMPLTEVDAMETNEFAGDYPDDNTGDVPLNIQANSVTSVNGGNTITSVISVTLSWPDSDLISYTLQQSSSVTSPNWLTVTNVPVLVGGTNDQVTLPIASTLSFFRLTAP